MIAELLIILTILILNLSVVLLVRSRTTMIIFIMLANLITILFYSLIIPEAQNFKELIIATIIFSTIILALISNSNHIYNIPPEKPKKIKFIILSIIVGIFTIIVSSGVFYLTKNINKVAAAVREKQISRAEEIEKNPLIFPGHPAHIAVKKYYFQGNYGDDVFKLPENKPIAELYDDKYKQKLQSNILFKRITDAIIIIAGMITILLLNYRYNFKEKNS
jgi:hypothetical protein